ncbi:MAG: hypothetical protein K0S33_1833 [Bacteroidetes bacterium]|jgi:DNA-binding protein YbaB|nr:hypothetical protein [Bacteroidota bacterium]
MKGVILYDINTTDMFGKLGDMMGKIQEAKKQMEETKAKLETIEVVSESADGSIKIVMNANRKIKSLKIDEKLQSGSNAELEKQLIAELTIALEKANDINESEMKKVAMGMLPGGLF